MQKHAEANFDALKNEPAVFAYVMDPRKLKISETVDVSYALNTILDWGGVSATLEAATTWQVSAEDARLSDVKRKSML